MFQDRLILRTKLAPPRLHRDTLHRERMIKRLLDASDYRLTVIQAGTGYGKTTALADLAAEDHKLVWYHLDPVDADPLTFLLHLIYGFSKLFADIADTLLALLERWERDVKDSPWSSVIDTLTNSLSEEVNEPVYVILDDAHYLNDSTETIQIVDYLIGRSPQNIHVILATRYPIKLPSSAYWRVRGEILELNQDELAFTEDETDSLFKDRNGLSLTAHQISLLLNKSEGWPIALQFGKICRLSLRRHPIRYSSQFLSLKTAGNLNLSA